MTSGTTSVPHGSGDWCIPGDRRSFDVVALLESVSNRKTSPTAQLLNIWGATDPQPNSLGLKRPEREPDHSGPFGDEGASPPIPPHVFIAWCLGTAATSPFSYRLS
jgi:hypothetical protein